jgi:hypothetical protein
MKKYGNQINLISKERVNKVTSNVHIHEIQPYNVACVVKEPSGKVIEVQTLKGGAKPYKVIYNGLWHNSNSF